MKKVKETYGLFTAITMIIGIVVGSGIFFKSDNVLIATGGSVALGCLVFIFAAMTIIFGGLAIGELASRTSNPGGVVTYADEFINKKAACGFGWFQTFIYYPTLTAILTWITGLYVCMLFGIDASLELQIAVGAGFALVFFLLNTFSAQLGGLFQNGSTIIKLIPLILVGVLGTLFGNPISLFQEQATANLATAGWLTAIGPIAFSFDGWVVATSVSHEIKNSKRNLPIALTVAPIFILIIYLAYFIGVNSLLGPESVIALQDSHAAVAVETLFGPIVAKATLIFVVIAVMGTLNGLILGYIRMPYALSLRNMLPGSTIFKKVSDTIHMPVNSAIFAGITTYLWLGVHYFCVKYNLLYNSDISEISIVVSYLLYTALYYRVFRLYKEGKITSKFKGIVVPLLATCGSAMILFGGLQNPLFIFYAIFCLIISCMGFYAGKNATNLEE